MSTGCPYDTFAATAWWRASVADLPFTAVDPGGPAPFRITQADKIATAGSCFAQEIGRYLRSSGYTFLDAEPGPSRLTADERLRRQYGVFSARYGNVYTTRQMLQLVQRAYGQFVPAEDHWAGENGSFFDPFRPSVEPGGFSSLEELRWEREQHLAAVRTVVESADILVFTLGLTEGWRSKTDGAVYPSCPGCGVGEHDPALHEAHNLRVSEVLEDLQQLRTLVKARNPALRIILTVSPVPLIATMSGQHVLTATTYSKSVLRAAAGEFCAGQSDACYFPSYEIVTGAYARGAYFAENLRTVTRAGVDHVMRCFFNMFADGVALPAAPDQQVSPPPVERSPDVAAALALVCDEEELQRRYEASRG
ncbi:MAG: GSCFA domain-containing protein [Alphaproteobacteria bacterium]|nr:GSCFA domain-containing protein [Alphaproteobacteria bacterium]